MTSSRSIPHLTRLTRRVYAGASSETLGMNLKQVATLASLRDRGALPQQSLCDVLHTTQNTVVAWLNDLEDKGYITRQRDAEDRRKHNVVITESGMVALEKAETTLRGLEDEVLAGLTVEERTQLRRLLTKALETST